MVSFHIMIINSKGFDVNLESYLNTKKYSRIKGRITGFDYFYNEDGTIRSNYLFVYVETNNGPVTFSLTPNTFYSDCSIKVGDFVYGYYLLNQPMILIYPPQYNILVFGLEKPDRTIKVDYFDQQLLSSDNTLQLNISDSTWIVDKYGRPYCGKITDRDLFIIYLMSTKSMPAITTPTVIVLLDEQLP